jgi:hypothetical protein
MQTFACVYTELAYFGTGATSRVFECDGMRARYIITTVQFIAMARPT